MEPCSSLVHKRDANWLGRGFFWSSYPLIPIETLAVFSGFKAWITNPSKFGGVSMPIIRIGVVGFILA